MAHHVSVWRSGALTVAFATSVIAGGVNPAFAQDAQKARPKKLQQITHADRKAAAKRAAKLGVKPGVSGHPQGVRPATGQPAKPDASRSDGRTP